MKKRIVVIGSGLAGSLICNELVKVCDVTLIERGPKNSIQLPRVQYIKKKMTEVPTFCFGEGGTTNLWHNGLIPINASDITCAEFRNVIHEAQLFTDQAASALFFRKKSYRDEYTNLVTELNALSNEILAFPHGIDCLIYPKKYRKLTVGPKVNGIYDVKDIEFLFKGQNIKSVIYTKDHQKCSIDADIVIVSAGALGTPKILQKIMAAAGVAFDSLGVGFIDHPVGFVGKIKFKKHISEFIKKLSTYDRGHYISRNAIRLRSSCGRYTACAYFRPALTMTNNLSIYKYKSAIGAGAGMGRLKKMFSWKLFHPDIVAEIVAHLLPVHIPGRTYNILFVGEQKRGVNRVFYQGDDLMVDWSISQEEIDIYRNMLNGLKIMLESLADDINIETNINDDWLWSMAHHSGTISLGATDNDIVDRNLKLRCCQNAYVCDGSVIQEHSYANTGLAIGQLAFRLVKRIQDDAKG